MLTGQLEIARLASKAKEMGLTSLNKHLTLELLKEAYRLTRKDGAVGIDGQTAGEFEVNLEENLKALLEEAKSGRYKAPPVRRVYIPKGDSSTELRPLGIPTFRDKVLQRAVVMLLTPVYEQNFLDCSHGFRPGRSALKASKEVDALLFRRFNGGWVVEVDIRKYFETMDHEKLRELINLRIRDGVLLRLIGKWLKAGVVEEGQRKIAESGSPQGGVISPLLSNVYLHYVLDVWFHDVVLPRLKGAAELIRFADDFVIICKQKTDAERILAVLPKRFAKFGLSLHPDKTKLIDFSKQNRVEKDDSDDGPAETTFTFLGFTFMWGKSRKGKPTVWRKTNKDRLKRIITRIGKTCRFQRHHPIKVQQSKLNSMLTGHYNYYGVTGNFASLQKVYRSAEKQWYKWLRRRAQKKKLRWEQFNAILAKFPLRSPRILHSAYRT